MKSTGSVCVWIIVRLSTNSHALMLIHYLTCKA